MSDSSLSPAEKRRRVVIVGRPNVGKSTLFNRLLGRRRAITDPTPGVTRDPIESECAIEGRPVLLVDTGGFKVDRDHELDEQIVARSLAAIETADAVLFVVEVDRTTPEDAAFMELLRRQSAKVILVVNKVDDPAKEPLVWNFHAYGFPRVVGVSAEHGRNFQELRELLDAFLGEAADAPLSEPRELSIPANEIRLAILGKPNTGKSTLMNRLAGSERSIVSPIPGTTRDVIEGELLHRGIRLRILDTAGIRRKSRVEESLEYYTVNRAIRSIEDSDVVLLVVDSLESVTDQDKKIAALVVRRGKGIVLVLNKWDLVEAVPNRREAFVDRIRFLFPLLDFAPVVPISALTGDGISKLLSTVFQVWRELNKRIETATLNRALGEWNARFAPKSSSASTFRARYVTQVHATPLRFVLFVNKRRGFPASWVEYLKNRLRKDFGMAHVPIEVELRE